MFCRTVSQQGYYYIQYFINGLLVLIHQCEVELAGNLVVPNLGIGPQQRVSVN